MLKNLLKKQLLEIRNTLFVRNKKKNSKPSKNYSSIILMAFVYVMLFFMFFVYTSVMCNMFFEINREWLYVYFALVGISASILGLIGSVFTTYTTLYNAKDNDLLLSMPIKPKYILFARLFGIWVMSLFYVSVVILPAIISYAIVEFNVVAILCQLILMFVLSFFILAMSCILGWLVALIGRKVKNKSFITVIISLLFICVYFYFCLNLNQFITQLVPMAEQIGETLKSSFYPIYLYGLACLGDFVSLLIFFLMIAVVFFIIYLIMSSSFIKFATSQSHSTKKVKCNAKIKAKSVFGSLLSKEFKKYLSSANYMLNCSLSTLFMTVIGVALIIINPKVDELLYGLFQTDYHEFGGLIALIVIALMCSIGSMNYITAPSISLEGKNIWILQSLPIDTWQVLKAKLSLHLILTEIPLIFVGIVLSFILKLGVIWSIFIIAFPILFTVFMAELGLTLNLKMPNLNWTNEVYVIKSGAAVGISLFGGWVVVAILGLIYYLLSSVISAVVFIIIASCIMVSLIVLLLLWLKKKGTLIFQNL